MPAAADVLSFIDWVEGLLWREAHRQDPSVEWQPDMSWDEIAACIGCEAPRLLAPEDPVADVDLAVELYWPVTTPKSSV